VSVKALVKNISDHDIFLVTDSDGSVDDDYYHVETVVGPNNAVFTRPLAHFGRGVIRTISPGATLEAMLDKKALGFDADWIAPRTYGFKLIYSDNTDPRNNPVESNVLTIQVPLPPPGRPTPLTLKLTGPETVAAGDAVRVDLTLKNMSNFEIIGPVHQLNLLKYAFSVRDASGREVPLNDNAEGVKGANTITTVQPGETVSSYTVLSEFYDLSQPGTYHVQVSQPPYGYPEAGRVFSNVLTIHVAPAAPR
jgi:hypothetical protein